VTYGEFVPAAMKRGVALIAIKPLGAGSIVRLDPRRPRPKASLETEDLSAAVPVGDVHEHIPVLEEAADKLRDELDRSPDETLPQAALRFVYSKPFISSVLTGMYLEEELQENCQALMNYAERKQARLGVLGAARELAALSGDGWLPSCYRWLDQRWKPRQLPVA
jgi:aryl-alcohol dehydrogenase-like predicted oxidoreductase